jgi:hypothetical protein
MLAFPRLFYHRATLHYSTKQPQSNNRTGRTVAQPSRGCRALPELAKNWGPTGGEKEREEARPVEEGPGLVSTAA